MIKRRKRYLYESNVVPLRTRYRHNARHRLLCAASATEAPYVISTSTSQTANMDSNDEQLMGSLPSTSGDNQAPLTSTKQEIEISELQPSSPRVESEADGHPVVASMTRSDSGIAFVESDCDDVMSYAGSISSATDNSEGVENVEDPNELSSSHEDDDNEECESLNYQECEPLNISNSVKEVEDEEELFNLKNPLSDTLSATEGDVFLMCLALGLRHSLSWAAIVDILKMVNSLFDCEVVRASKYFFLKYMEVGKQDTTFHVYCPYCERYLGTKQEVINTKMMACKCGTVLEDINKASTYFLSLNLQNQIQELFNDESFLKGIKYRFKREKINEDSYEDIYDGEVYKGLSAPGEILSEEYNLSYCFNTDGFPVGGKSGKQTCWPIYLQINELPPNMRSKYMLLAGIYVGKKDPNMKIFLYPFVEEANVFSSVGVNWTLNGITMNSKVIPLCACVDTPARAKLLNMTFFNGYYGCTVCYCSGEDTKSGLRYPMPPSSLRERTHEEILVCAAQAHANIRSVRNKKKRSVKGVKGVAPIHTTNHLDLARGVRADTMHSKLIGNAKQLGKILIKSAGKEYYIGSDIRLKAINDRLLSIRPPSSIMRPPRCLQHYSQWKATEWRAWLLFYGVVCLRGIIPHKYVVHFSMLATSVYITLQKSVTPEDLDKAHCLILRYVSLLQEYFGKNAMVYNVHLLLHTKRDVECLGPAWTNTAFGFEGANKTLLELKKNSYSIAKEIAKKYLTFKALPSLCHKYATTENTLRFCETISERPLKTFCKIGKALLVGSGKNCTLSPEEFHALERSMLLSFREVLSFDRMLYNGTRYCTGSYTSSQKRYDDSYICIQNETRGRIHRICSIPEEKGASVVILVRELILNEEPIFKDEYGKYCPIKTIVTEGPLIAVRPTDITTQCVAMFLESESFICDVPYGCYSDS